MSPPEETAALSIFEHGRNDGPSGDLTSRKVLRAQTDAITGTAFESSSSWVASVSARDFVIWDQSDGTQNWRSFAVSWVHGHPTTNDESAPSEAGCAEVWDRGTGQIWTLDQPDGFQRENAWYRVTVATSQPWTALG